jgi:hypothetical protein
MKKLIILALLALCGCTRAQPVVSRPQQPTTIERRCHCWQRQSYGGSADCPCDSDCDCKPKSKCGCECHCGEPKK